MKLASYAVREAISNKDWPAAIAILAEHFGIIIPPEYTRHIYCHPHYLLEVTVDMPSARYSWLEFEGFRSSCVPRYLSNQINIRSR